MRQLPWIGVLVMVSLLGVLAACGGSATSEATQTGPGSTAAPTQRSTRSPTRTPISMPTATATMDLEGEVQDITFNEFFSNPDQYNGRDIVLTGFYFHGGENNLLSERMEGQVDPIIRTAVRLK